MLEFTNYAGRFRGFRGQIVGLPAWARLLVVLAALPGIVLVGLSLMALIISIIAVLILTVPVYSLLRRLIRPASIPQDQSPISAGVKRVEATIVE